MSQIVKFPFVVLFTGLTILTACSSSIKPTTAEPTAAVQVQPKSGNDFPTLSRVEYVLQCMEQNGGQNYDNLYHCTCAVDHIASKMNHEEFDQAQAFTYLFNTPGERGGEFRDPPQSEKLRTLLKSAKAEAAEICFPAKKKPAAGKKK